MAGITLTAIVDGKSGLQDHISRKGDWRAGVRWYAAAIHIAPIRVTAILLSLTYMVTPLFSPKFLPEGILIGLLAGFFKEIGWMGYDFPEMELKHSALTTGITLGLIWTAWHIEAACISHGCLTNRSQAAGRCRLHVKSSLELRVSESHMRRV